MERVRATEEILAESYDVVRGNSAAGGGVVVWAVDSFWRGVFDGFWLDVWVSKRNVWICLDEKNEES